MSKCFNKNIKKCGLVSKITCPNISDSGAMYQKLFLNFRDLIHVNRVFHVFEKYFLILNDLEQQKFQRAAI